MDSESSTLTGSGEKQSFFSRFKYFIIAGVIVAIALVVVLSVVLSASSNDKDDNNSWESLIVVGNLMGHLQMLQQIADANGGTRASTTTGYNQSVDYIVDQLRKHTDYNVTVQPFTYLTAVFGPVSGLNATSSTGNYYLTYNQDFGVMGSPAGTYNIDGNVTQVLGYGCSLSEYDNVLPNSVALIKRGNCTFAEKVALAVTKNPSAVIIYNEGNTVDRLGLFSGSVGVTAVPVFATSYYAGISLIGSIITVSVTSQTTTSYTMNVVADTKLGSPDAVIVIGSHLDSVPAGPGINDNGSGSAFNIELAKLLASRQSALKNKIRFIWFGAEEVGLLGSYHYVEDLNATNPAGVEAIAADLNFDMIGSPNFIRAVYNGSSDLNSPGSAVLQTLFNDYFGSLGLAVVPTAFDSRSDYAAFLAAGIPSGGLFTGAEVVKTIEERITFGGLAAASYDPCYHKACDTYDNINQVVYEQMAKAAAHVVEKLATQENLRAYLSRSK